MLLHNDRESFNKLITDVSKKLKIKEALIEKDYYVTLFLRELTAKEPLLVFKGGTCLSKCFKLINRFSEDIDINLDGVKSLTQSRKKQHKTNIVAAIDKLGLTLTNPDSIKSGMDYNVYKIAYPSSFASPSLKQHLEIESVFRIGAFPTVKMPASSLIYDYLKSKGLDNIIAQFELEPFEVRVQSLERTFVDKVFAICDYYMNGRVTVHSRHIYDLYKILPHIKLDDKMRCFVEEVRRVREGKHDCPSANIEVSLAEIIGKIITENTYKNDYNNITSVLLYEKVTYDQVIAAIQTISDWLNKSTEVNYAEVYY